jgi:enoyl-[acyl-carrier-protein] reductase (NADH)
LATPWSLTLISLGGKGSGRRTSRSSCLPVAQECGGGFTRTLARELGPAGILVNAVMPGITLTERIGAAGPEAFWRAREQASPIGRLPRPEKVVPTVAFLGPEPILPSPARLFEPEAGCRAKG